MAQPSVTEISSRVRVMLTGVNLDLVTAKTVRRELEEHFKMDLSDRKKEIGGIINEIINSEALNGSPPQGAGHPGKKEKTVPPMKKEKTEPPVRKEKSERERSPEEDDAELARRLQEEEETGGKRATRSGRQSGQKRRSSSHSKKKKKTKSKEQASDSSDSDASGSDSDSDGKGKKKVKKTATKGGYLKPIPLSDELSTFVGADEMPRHEVVKRVWSYCKENNLLDPKNKQFAICDDELRKVVGVKRFRLFGMMKLLGKHFLANNAR